MNPTRVTIHCTATGNGQAVDIQALKKYHTAPPPKGRGFSDIGYHFIIQPDGTVDKGRPVTVQGAHVEGENQDNIGVALVGLDKFTDSQFLALRYLLDDLRLAHEIMPWSIYCHNEFPSARAQGKTCPNFDIHVLLGWYLGKFEEAICNHVL